MNQAQNTDISLERSNILRAVTRTAVMEIINLRLGRRFPSPSSDNEAQFDDPACYEIRSSITNQMVAISAWLSHAEIRLVQNEAASILAAEAAETAESSLGHFINYFLRFSF